MGIVLLNTKTIDQQGLKRAYIECSDINTDLTEYIEEKRKEGISKRNITILIENSGNSEDADLMLTLEEFEQAKEKLRFLTSHVREEDSEEEKFAKIVTSLHKHIKYAYTKTGDKNVGKSQNFIDGLEKGRCVCIGMAQILREALLMHGIECELVESAIDEDRGHEWNKIKLGHNWYNWDQTNIKANILSLNNIGKNLKADYQLNDKKIYQEHISDIICDTPPSKELVEKINFYAKKNKNKYPRKNNIFSSIFDRLKKQEKMALPQPTNQDIIVEELKEGDLDIIEQEKIAPFIFHNIDLWKIKTCNTKDVSQKIRTLYLGLDFQDDIEKLTKDYKEEFWEILYLLIDYSDNKNYVYIGNILRVSNLENKGLKCITPNSTRNRKAVKEINDAILNDIENENTRINERVNMNTKKDVKIH